tara:strand:- start:9554 stop:9712 length:159 start_codon:yes stop_codon:yes gene_type:complete
MTNTIEEILYSAHEHGKRKELLKYLPTMRNEYPSKPLEELYQLAYEQITKTP